MLGCTAAFAPLAQGAAGQSVGTPEQIAWVRSAASRFVTAELAGNGESACAVLNRPLRAVLHGTTCAQRWDARLAALLRKPGEHAALKRQWRNIQHAAVVVHGDQAQLMLQTRLIHGPNLFKWTENCWMLEG
jgi:hypothetical protein